MDKISLFRVLGLPDSFGAVLLILALILLLSPYFSGADFGIFKIPVISQPGRKSIKILGPIVFILCVLSFLPVFSTKTTAPTSTAQPSPALIPLVTPTPIPTPSSTANATSTPSLGSADAIAAQKLGAEWFSAMKRHDVEVLIHMADFPFYFDQEILAGPDDMRRRFRDSASKPNSDTKTLHLGSVKARTIAEWKQGGFEAERDRILGNITYNDNDFVVILTIGNGLNTEGEGVVLYMRKVGSKIKLAGFWD